MIIYMDLSYNKITSLDGLEHYPALETLILDCNRIEDVEIPYCPSLTSLSLNKNKVGLHIALNELLNISVMLFLQQIGDLDRLIDNLKERAPHLRFLSLLGNRACPHQLMGLDIYDDADYRRFRWQDLYLREIDTAEYGNC